MDTFEIKIKRILFHNEESGYCVMSGSVKGVKDNITITGIFTKISLERIYTVTGEWTSHPRFGRQFAVSDWTELLPTTLRGIEQYLASGVIKGIGPTLAKRIVDTLGLKTLEYIDNEPKKLFLVPGIGEAKQKSIIEGWEENKQTRQIMLFLKEYDISNALARKIYNQYGQNSIDIIKKNPYRLCEDIKGIGFLTSDRLALSMGFEPFSNPRICAGIKFTLEENASGQGHCFLDMTNLVEETKKLLSLPDSCDSQDVDMTIRFCVHDMSKEDKVILEHDKDGETLVYLPWLWHSEDGTARRLKNLIRNSDENSISVNFEEIESTNGLTYDTIQKEAISTALSKGVSVITGGPGTGKTTVVKGIITALEDAGFKVVLAAPTGKAAKRMEEGTGRKAKTLHRLLEYGMNGFARDDNNPIEGDALIVDECSMIDINLMYSLLKAMPAKMRLCLVGDVDQLPSVGPGSVLRDIIDSDIIPVTRLKHIFRQAEKSEIITAAHTINEGKVPTISNSKDLLFIRCENTQIADKIIDMVNDLHNKGVDWKDIQVLSPMKNGEAGTINLNARLQQLMNPDGKKLTSGILVFHEDDRVINTRNNYKNNVFNGDEGYVCSVTKDEDEQDILSVIIDGKEVLYEKKIWDDLMLSYCLTIHKSQGSEFPYVIIPVTTQHYIMLQRTLIYTAITRAKSGCILVGSDEALERAVKNNVEKKRFTYLKILLQNV